MAFYLFALGCKVNSYENDTLRKALEERGEQEAASPEEASLIIINTCSVTATADQKSRQHIRRMRRLSPKAIIAVMGCYSEMHGQESLAMGADIVVGTSSRHRLLEYVDAFLKTGTKICDVKKSVRHESYEEMGQMALSDNARAYLKIQDGCDNFCSYCIIPLTRGISRSRKEEDILKEANRLALNGYREIVLTGIDVGSYADGDERLSGLVSKLLEVAPASFRLRIGSLEMSQVDERLIGLFKENKRLVPHLHLPLQSGSERILELMGRKYDLDGFYQLLTKLKKEIPGLALSTDVIVGFPSETEEDFLKTCEFVQKAGFMRLHVFPYSPRPYTKAARMVEQLPMSLKKERVRRLTKIGEELAAGYLASYQGKTLNVLLEEELPPVDGLRVFRGYSENYLDLKVKAKENLLGQVISAPYLGGGYLNYPDK